MTGRPVSSGRLDGQYGCLASSYKVGRRRLYVGAWKHGVSIYGWPQGSEAGFIARHPGLKTSKGTIQLRPEDAAGIPDEELRNLVRAALEA